MIKRIVNIALGKVGYRISKLKSSEHFILREFLNQEGKFDYEKYRSTQEAGNKAKLDKVWVLEDNIAYLSNYIKGKGIDPKFGICHGTRRGKEQEWFRKYLNCEVIGTEISETAQQFPYTIQWDFHDIKPEWIDAVDFIYSNSLDHSYDPEKCLNQWLKCIKPGGFCFIEHGDLSGPEGSNELDPFGAELTLMPYLITIWGKGKYFVREILPAPQKNQLSKYLYYIVIQKPIV